MTTVGLLHPGRMGAAVGRQLAGMGHRVLWDSAGRSPATAERAERAGLEPADDLTATCEVIISLCPPASAEQVAEGVTGFEGVFVEANAISPARVRRIADRAGRVVDGCVIGSPPTEKTGTRLYLSGVVDDAETVAALFAGTAVDAVVIEGGVGQASALKMAFGSYNKTMGALAAVSHALAETYGVGDHLLTEARRITGNQLADPSGLPSVAARAWRWAPEMDEVAATLGDAGLPAELAEGAAAVFRRWDEDRDDFGIALPEALAHLRTTELSGRSTDPAR
jgi:3-hydroxyisobutyrate dehydrogenase-like beta-hydroxyacid dehydrogenase